jgi:hypothetical protein
LDPAAARPLPDAHVCPQSYRATDTPRLPNRANVPSVSGPIGVAAAVLPTVGVPAEGVPVPAGRVPVTVPPGVPVPSGEGVPVPPGVAVRAGEADPAGLGLPLGLPLGLGVSPIPVTVVLSGERVAVPCALVAAATVAETRAWTVPSTFTGAASGVAAHAVTSAPAASAETARHRP